MSIYIPDAVNGDLAAIELVLFKYSADITIMNTFSLEEKSVIITGGIGGYGLAICELILKRKGRVLLTDLKSDSEAEEILSNRFKDAFEAKCVLYTKCDVTSEADIEAAFQTAQQKLGSY